MIMVISETVFLDNMRILLLYLSSEISSFRVTGGDCGVAPQQQVMHRGTHNLTATNHYCSFSCH